ncbi:MAG: CvpA family protein [Bacilli bacterium]|nr:CvpA family protein [Bacilli bacterium]
MNIIDVIVILVIVSCMVAGFKRGFTRELVSAVGFFLVVVLSFYLKNPISVFLYEHLPFFRFGGIIKGVTALNIFLYEVFAFLIAMSILTFILKMLEQFTNIFEGLLKVTLVLAPISKIGGMLVGIIEGFVWAFIILFIATLPMFRMVDMDNSKFKDKILNNTPILSSVTSKSLNVINDFASVKEKYEKSSNAKEFNRETLDLFLKYDVVSVKSADTLIKDGKIKIDNPDELLNKYKDA